MTQAIDLLQAEIDRQTAGLTRMMAANEPALSILVLIREMDVLWSFNKQFEEEVVHGNLPLLEALGGGWQLLLQAAYAKLTMRPEPMFFAYDPQHTQQMVPFIRCSGQVACVQRLLDMARHQLISLEQIDAANFSFKLLGSDFSVELFDKIDVEFVREVFIDEIDAEAREQLRLEQPRIQKIVEATVHSPQGIFISYSNPPEVDVYFEKLARLHVRRLQMHEDFGDDDIFGGIPYKKYVDFVETVMAVAHRHQAYSLACIKQNPNAHIATLVTYFAIDSPFDEDFLNRFELSQLQMQQVLSCITLSKDSFQDYLSIPYAAPPPYVRMSSEQTIRSSNGCLNNPFQFLNFELKRRFKDDYFEAVNRREDRFRKDAFSAFYDERIIKVPREVNIKIDGQRTDIDCVLYDSHTKTLGLFQLKWQEPFAHSLKKRRNSSSEFYKANKWVDRVWRWLDALDDKAVLNSLQISELCPSAKEINDVFVFVLGRHAGHFTAGTPDKRAVWGSWWQMIANLGKVKAVFDDPIKLAAVALEFMTPAQRIARNEMPQVRTQSLKIGPYMVQQDS